MLTDDIELERILRAVPYFPLSNHYVGIDTGGAIIARILSRERNRKFSMVKDQELKGEVPSGHWTLFDDVVTTGASLLEAISIVGSSPGEIVAVVDRREKNENPKVQSMFEVLKPSRKKTFKFLP